MADRPTWPDYFLSLAAQVSTRATCPRLSVGAVIVRDSQVLSLGYNGSMRGEAHCLDVGCLMVEGHCSRTVHAEANAIAQAAMNGVSLRGAKMYVTHKPCWPCRKLIWNSGIVGAQWSQDYGSAYPEEKP